MASQTNIEFTPIVFKGMRFIMSKTPNNKNIDTYITVNATAINTNSQTICYIYRFFLQKWKEFNVKHVVRCCLPSDADYDDKPLTENGIQRHVKQTNKHTLHTPHAAITKKL